MGHTPMPNIARSVTFRREFRWVMKNSFEQRLELPPKYLLILIAPMAVWLGSEYFIMSLGNAAPNFPTIGVAEDKIFPELSGRYIFFSAALLFSAIAIAILTVFLAELFVHHTRRSALTSLAVFILIASAIVYLANRESEYDTYHLLGEKVFSATLQGGCISGPIGRTSDVACEGRVLLETLENILKGTNVFAATGSTAAVFGLILSLSRPSNIKNRRLGLRSADQLEKEIEAIVTADAMAKRYLYCAGLILTSGVTLIMSWMHWPGNIIADETIRENYKTLANSLSFYFGVSYSVLILSYYLPTTLILAERGRRCRKARMILDKGSEEGPVAFEPIANTGPLEAIKVVFAIVSPLLASAIGSFGQIDLTPG